MNQYAIGLVILANLSPAGEQLAGIPLGLFLGLDPYTTFFVSLAVNCFLFFPVYFALKYFYKSRLSKIRAFNTYMEKSRQKVKPYMDKYGVYGLTFVLSLPGPFTGTYTATMVSWYFGLDWRKAFVAIFVGSAVGGLLILAGFTTLSSILAFLWGLL